LAFSHFYIKLSSPKIIPYQTFFASFSLYCVPKFVTMSEGPLPSTWKLVLSFTFALIVANVSGAQYVYPSFGTALAEHFRWSAMENSFVSTATFLGVSFSGPLCAKLVETFGDANALRIAAAFGFTGFFLLSQTFADILPQSFALCVIYLLMIGIGGATGYLVALDSQVNYRA
jgi:MFS family permease